MWHQVTSKPPDSKANGRKKEQSPDAVHILHFLEAKARMDQATLRRSGGTIELHLKERKVRVLDVSWMYLTSLNFKTSGENKSTSQIFKSKGRVYKENLSIISGVPKEEGGAM